MTGDVVSAEAPRKNNINFLRLALALYVAFSHIRLLNAFPVVPRVNIPVDVAVQAFYVLSGYLVFKSWDYASDWREYLSKRARRIYPAYFIVIVSCAILLVFLSNLSPVGYFFNKKWLSYLLANLSFMNFLAPNLPGVFEHNDTMMAVDGALWTIKVEVAFYAIVPLIAWVIHRFSRWKTAILVGIYALSYMYFVMMQRHTDPLSDFLAKQLPGQLRYFVVGALVYYLRLERTNVLRIAGLVALVGIVVFGFDDHNILYPLMIGLCTLAFAFERLPVDGARFGDLSYGVYLVHFPVIQVFIALGLFRAAPLLSTVSVFAVVLTLAYFSWHLIEKPALRRAA